MPSHTWPLGVPYSVYGKDDGNFYLGLRDKNGESDGKCNANWDYMVALKGSGFSKIRGTSLGVPII